MATIAPARPFASHCPIRAAYTMKTLQEPPFAAMMASGVPFSLHELFDSGLH